MAIVKFGHIIGSLPEFYKRPVKITSGRTSTIACAYFIAIIIYTSHPQIREFAIRVEVARMVKDKLSSSRVDKSGSCIVIYN